MTPQLKVLRLNRGQHRSELNSLQSYNGTRFTLLLLVPLQALLCECDIKELFLECGWIEAIGAFVSFVGPFSPKLSLYDRI